MYTSTKALVAAVVCLTAVAHAQEWSPPTYSPAVIAAFKNKTHLNAPAMPDLGTWRPYDDEKDGTLDTTVPEDWVCAIHYPTPDDRSAYETKQYASREAAEAAGDFVTHQGRCGLCSSLNDLAVYMEKPDLTSEGRFCALKSIRRFSQNCHEAIGFTPECARMWVENALHTRKNCLGVCLAHVSSPNNDPPESFNLNPCLQCDEDKSGAVYKAIGGRSRRSSGLNSAINRPPSSIYQLEHDYY